MRSKKRNNHSYSQIITLMGSICFLLITSCNRSNLNLSEGKEVDSGVVVDSTSQIKPIDLNQKLTIGQVKLLNDSITKAKEGFKLWKKGIMNVFYPLAFDEQYFQKRITLACGIDSSGELYLLSHYSNQCDGQLVFTTQVEFIIAKDTLFTQEADTNSFLDNGLATSCLIGQCLYQHEAAILKMIAEKEPSIISYRLVGKGNLVSEYQNLDPNFVNHLKKCLDLRSMLLKLQKQD